MNKKLLKIIIGISVVLGCIAIGFGVYVQSNNKQVENKTQNATLNLDTYGTVTEETNIYLLADKESPLINTIKPDITVTLLSDTIYTSDDGTEYFKVLYEDENEFIYSGFIEKAKISIDNNEEVEEPQIQAPIVQEEPIENAVVESTMIIGYNEEKNIELEGIDSNTKWEIDNSKVVSITNNKIKGLSGGITKIRTTIDNKDYIIEVKVEQIIVNVKNEIAVGKTEKITTELLPKDSTATLAYSVSDKTIATVKDNTITAKKEGTVILTVSTKNTSTKTTIKVKPNYKNIKIKGSSNGEFSKSTVSNKEVKTVEYKMNKMKAKTDSLKLSVPNTELKELTWSSSNKNVVIVDKNGVITPIDTGTATIKVVYTGGDKSSDSVNIKVIKNYNAAVAPNADQKYVFTHIDSQELRDDSGARHRLQQFDLVYDNNFNVDNVFYMFPEGGSGASAYKSYYVQKYDGRVRTISYADGGHGAAFSIIDINKGIVNVLADTYGVLTDGDGDSLRIGSLNLNFGGQSWGSYLTYTQSHSSQSFAYKFGCQNNSNKKYYYDEDCHNKYYQTKSNVTTKVPLTAYDNINNLVAFWTSNKSERKISIYRFSDLQKTTEFENITAKGVKPISTVTVHDIGGYRQGMAIHRGVVYGLWGKPASPSSIKWYIRGYDILTGKTVYTKNITYSNVKGLASGYSEIEPEGIQIKTNPQNGNSYVHIGIARMGNKKYSSIYRINGA